MKKAIKILLIGMMVLPLLFSCSDKKPLSYVTWEGNVYDKAGGQPVEGYWVTLEACAGGNIGGRNQCDAYKVASAQTDASGHFKIHAQAAWSDQYWCWYGIGHFENVSKKHLKDHSTLYLN